MRTVKQLPAGIAKETDLDKFPDSTVVNETDTSDGTPVVREIYSDILTNLYKVLRFTKNMANGIEDNEQNGYQLFDSLRMLTNTLNDAEQQLNLSGTVFSVNIDLSILPNRYVCIGKAVDDYVPSTSYTFKGTGAQTLPFSAPVPFKSGDVVLLVIDTAGVRGYSLVPKEQSEVINEFFTPYGSPLAFNDSKSLLYQENGILITDEPRVYDIQAYVRLSASDATLIVYEMVAVAGFLYFLVFSPVPMTYYVYRSPLSDLPSVSPVYIIGSSFPVGQDNRPNIYTDGDTLYITNQTGNVVENGNIDVFVFDHALGSIQKTGNILLSDFEKSTNTIVKNGKFYELLNGIFRRYSIADGSKAFVAEYPGYLGIIFGYNGSVYFTTGEVAKLWKNLT